MPNSANQSPEPELSELSLPDPEAAADGEPGVDGSPIPGAAAGEPG